MSLMPTNNCSRKKKINMYHNVSCKSNYVMYLLKCLLSKVQYVGKSKTCFYIKLHNHRKDIKNPNSIEPCKYFKSRNHVSYRHGKLMLIEQLNNIKNTSTEVLKQRLKDRVNYWLKRIKTLTPFSLNQKLN